MGDNISYVLLCTTTVTELCISCLDIMFKASY